MNPAILVGVGVGATIAGFVLGKVITAAQGARRLEALAAEQQTSVQLILQRKVAEAGIDPGDHVGGHSFDDILAGNVKLANALLTHERQQIEMGDTQEFGLASTMRLESRGEILVPKIAKD